MTKIEKLNLAVDSQEFYHNQCMTLETQLDKDVKYIVDVDYEEWSKERMEQSLQVCQNLMLLSGKFVSEAEHILNLMSSLTKEEYESDIELLGKIMVSTRGTMKHQKRIYEKLIELQGILIEIIERF